MAHISSVVELLLLAASSGSRLTDAQDLLGTGDDMFDAAITYRNRAWLARGTGVAIGWSAQPIADRIAILTDAAVLADAEGA